MPRLIADRPILRTSSELAQVMASAAAREADGQRIIHLERGEPDFETPRHIVEALAAAAREGATHYPDPCGALPLRVALADKVARANGIQCHPEDIVVTAGATQGLFMAFYSLLAPGDEILLFSPYWMMVPRMIGLVEGARPRAFPVYLDLMEGALASGDLADRLRAALRPETRGLYLNTPNNPSGAVLAREHLEAIAAVAIDRDLWVVSDEAYEHILFDGARHVSLASLPGMAERTISVFSFSKSYAMTGWRMGYVVSPPPLRPVLGPTLGALTTYGVFPAVQSAGLAALRGPQQHVETMRRAYEERRDALLAGLEGQTTLRVPRPGGAFYAFPDVSAALEGRTDWDLVRDWLELGLAVLPGSAFGPHPDRVRLSLATRRDDVIEAARRLRERYAGVKRRPH
ncbi:MAG TPA: aminotransferase class I/II-fold pyridoxal phosphate-dependent enzyme [Terriglobales bacterium]|nr:aminotransferase class I/II-fold pyridoxal phosphate-dependent enzyme [Terriglobales bacterium]